jgi:DNA-binding IclR family transcriptional regulator
MNTIPGGETKIPQYYEDILAAIDLLPNATVREIAQLVDLSEPYTWRLIRRMDREGYLKITSDYRCRLRYKLISHPS